MANFQQALNQLMSDPAFAGRVAKEPQDFLKDHKLDANEVLSLMQVWLASGDPDAKAGIMNLCHCCCGQTVEQ